MTSLSRFHHLDKTGCRDQLKRTIAIKPSEWDALSATPELLEIADVMVESAVGCVAVPLGIAEGFLIDREEIVVPMAIEEPSVIAVASFAARLARVSGGFHTWASDSLIAAQVFLEEVSPNGEQLLQGCAPRVRQTLSSSLASLEKRGGGFREVRVARLPGTCVVRVEVLIDVRDAMGANRLNSAAELLRPLLQEVSGGRVLMSILGNEARDRIAGARVEISFEAVEAGLPDGADGPEAACRISGGSGSSQLQPDAWGHTRRAASHTVLAARNGGDNPCLRGDADGGHRRVGNDRCGPASENPLPLERRGHYYHARERHRRHPDHPLPAWSRAAVPAVKLA